MEKSKKSINMEGGFLFCGGWNLLKSVSVGSTFIREMRVLEHSKRAKNKQIFWKLAKCVLTLMSNYEIDFLQWIHILHFKYVFNLPTLSLAYFFFFHIEFRTMWWILISIPWPLGILARFSLAKSSNFFIMENPKFIVIQHL